MAKSTKITKVMKYQVLKPINMEWSDFESHMRALTQECRSAANKTMQHYFYFNQHVMDYKDIHGAYPNPKQTTELLRKVYPESTQKDLRGVAYGLIKNNYNVMSSSILIAMVTMVDARWKNDKKDIIAGVQSLPAYKRDLPIEIPSAYVKIEKSEKSGEYQSILSMFSLKYKKEQQLENCKVILKIGAKEKSMKDILNRIIDKEYNLGACKLQKQKNKWFLIVTYKFEKEETTNFVPDLTMGIDMGIVYPVYFAFNNIWGRGKIEGGEIDTFRKKIESRRLSMSRQGRHSNRKGKGREKLLAPTNVLENKITRFRNSTNHKYARYIIDEALKNNCGIIQMENLSGISKDNLFLKNWTYFDLQTKIENKAKEYGIKVIKIKPDYTSQRCSKCGIIDKENREDQSTFHCKHCDFKTNADYNAAKNISTPGIEEIIKDQLKAQEKVKKLLEKQK